MKFVFSFTFLCLVLGLVAGLAARELGYFSLSGEEIVFTVEKGENFAGLAARLQREGVIRSERALRWYVNFLPPAKSLKRGEFPLYRNMTVPALVKALTEGKPMEYKVTIPEGFNLFQIADLLAEKGFVQKAAFLAAARAPENIRLLPTLSPGDKLPVSVEGYLYPDTYFLQRVQTAQEIVQLMLQHFRAVYAPIAAELGRSAVVSEFRLTPHQVVILASIVEKETGAAHERPLVASIFVNRLRKRMRLQTDPTVIYALWMAQGSWDGNIRRRDLNAPGEYNTYQREGLPAGPIANPSLNAIRAVLAPAESEYLYFVSKNDGTHIFSKDYASHAKAVRETQLNPAAKDGKSWRNLPADQRAR